jgi:hypothetical protein
MQGCGQQGLKRAVRVQRTLHRRDERGCGSGLGALDF